MNEMTPQQRAIEALRFVMAEYDAWKANGRIADDRLSFIEARAALAAVDAEPKPECRRYMDDYPGVRAECERNIAAGKRCPDCPGFNKPAEPVHEPVAWGQLGLLNGKPYLRMNYDRTPYPPTASVVRNLNLVPLYTAPTPQRQPLTDEQIKAAVGVISLNEMTAINIARAVEKAHGIGDKT